MNSHPFELPQGASVDLVAYHTLYLDNRAERLEADAAHASAARLARIASEAAGVSWVMSLPEDHPDRIAWERALLAHSEASTRHEARLKALGEALSAEESALYNSLWHTWYFSDDNACDPKEHLSPSGRYSLVVTKHPTQPGRWAYSRGAVYRVGDSKPIASIARNFSHFPFSFVEKHGATGRDYLVGGSDYQGQTFIDLSDGARREHFSSGAEKGFGFCWASHRPSPDGLLLAVEGCVWAAPYEVHIYDFSDPMSPSAPRLLGDVGEYERLIGWVGPRTLQVDRTVRRVAIEGHRLHGREEGTLSDEEREEIETIALARGVDEDTLIVEATEAGATITV